jgi:hypothetical protein
MIVTVVVEALDGRVLDGAVHALDLAVGPWMIDLGEPAFDPVLVADPPEDVVEGGFVVSVIGELDAPRHCLSDQWRSNGSIGEHRMQSIGSGGDQISQELGGRLAGLLDWLGEGELAGPVDGHEQAWFAFGGLHLRNVDVEEPDRIAFEPLSFRFVTGDVGQAGDAACAGIDAALTASSVVSTAAEHRGSRPAAAAYGAETQRRPPPRPPSGSSNAAPTDRSSYPRPSRACATSQPSWD